MATRSYLKFLLRRLTSQLLPHVDPYRYILYHATIEVPKGNGGYRELQEDVLAEVGVSVPSLVHREYAHDGHRVHDLELTAKWYLTPSEAADFDSAKMFTKADEYRF